MKRIPHTLATIALTYATARNAYYLHHLPEKSRYKDYNMTTDKILAFPIAVLTTCALLPFKLRNDLVRLEYIQRSLPIPSHLLMTQVEDVIFT